MLNKYIIKLNILLVVLFLILIAIPTDAALIKEQDLIDMGAKVAEFGANAGYNPDDFTPLPVRIGRAIQIALGFVGTIFVILIIWSGFQWMTAGGNTETIGGAKKRMINATIGLVIVLAAYSIAWFVTEQLLDVTGVVEINE